ncbi:hypothetical protein C497_11802 [Halalkalicoccus jeotgali B3]|uniref:Uncharacterized protein n=1 Tax=Halalkalicoccus jeotgali (strain DSM 18796 / CECT 7217 / JCM 14584 / KCTC 4019 / B3) TaxID=795797 RepID=D8J4T9_HALJB|nr:hypothetical protein HacjB3_10865 [Halalkalicoccus jeotgali B3]ELY36035.1 hypothetical protein C497_11802 [Halalkalicoccus jeotgali B3]
MLIYVGIEYVVLQITGAFLVEQELVVVALLVVVWTMWAFLRILGRYA